MDRQQDRSAAQVDAFQVEIVGMDVRFLCRADQSLLAAMMAAGHRSLTVGCRSGGCGVCRVRILSGQFETGHMNRTIISAADEQSGIILSCRAYPRSDIVMQAMPRANGMALAMGRAA